MKIVKEGTWKNPWSKQVVCAVKECGAELLVEEKDLAAPARYISSSPRYTFVCPVCGKINDVLAKDIPTRVKETLDAARTVHYDD